MLDKVYSLKGEDSIHRKELNRWLKSKLEGKDLGNVLDIGTGGKPLKDRFNLQYSKYTSTDVHKFSGVDVVCSVYELTKKFREEEFNTVFLVEVLEHLMEPVNALKEIAKVMKPLGELYITVPMFYCIHGGARGDDYLRFTKYWFHNVFPLNGLHLVELKEIVPRGKAAEAQLNFMLYSGIKATPDLGNFPLGYCILVKKEG